MTDRPERPALDPATAERFPVIEAIDALEAWTAAPTDARRSSLVAAVGAVMRAAGATGAYLDVRASPMAPFTVGHGTLASRPHGEPPGVRRFHLTAGVHRVPLGTLWLEAPAATAASVVRVLELALDSAWARAEVAHTASRLDALDAATQAIASELDLDRVLQLIVDSVRTLAQARYAALGILDAAGRIERFITSGMSDEEREAIGAPPRGHGLLGLIIREGRSYRVADITRHEDAYGFPPGHPPMRSFLGVPIRVAGRSIGNVYLTDKEGAVEFGESDQELVEMFALHAGIAIQNARLHARVQQLAVVDERVRIGQDLHDGIIQGIYAVALSLEDVPELMADDPAEATARIDRAIDRLNTSIQDIRDFIVGLGPPVRETGLPAAVAAIVDELRLDPQLELRVDLDEPDEMAARLPSEAVSQLLQIVREALANVARHSGASTASLRTRIVDDVALLEIEDDGRGFDPTVPRGPGHFGLSNLHDRAASVGGTLRIESEPGRGTRIIVRLPLTEPEAAQP